jgi:hypothetical protein
VAGLREHGQRWKEIQKMVPTRTLVQIRTHAQKYFMKLDKHGKSLGTHFTCFTGTKVQNTDANSTCRRNGTP